MRVAPDAGDAALAAGFDRIREQFGVPGEFPADVLAAADEAAARAPGAEHADRTGEPFVTLDPATATDLDQAFALERTGDTVVLHYAIADVGFFVAPGDVVDAEARRRGVTVYLPDAKAPLYPPRLSEDAASLLPGRPRPAVVFTVHVDTRGDVEMAGVERSVIRSRAKLAYDTVTAADLPAEFPELARRIAEAERRRGAPRVDFPDQEIERVDGRWRLAFRPRLESEEHNAGLSLATNLSVAGLLHAAGTGLFRVMPEPDERSVRRLRHSARAFGLDWPRELPLADFEDSLAHDDPRAAAFLIAVRRASGGASYAPFVPGERPWHAAMAATYAHATAPLRRLGDRYVIDAALALAAGRPVPAGVQSAFAELPELMRRAEARANRVEAAVVDLAEAVALAGRQGETFAAVVVDEDDRGALVQLVEPAVLVRVGARRVDPGDDVRVRLDAVDVPARAVSFSRVG